MDSIEFVRKYNQYLGEIEKVVKVKYMEVLETLRKEDPHDLVSPDTWFNTEIQARGYVWSLFLAEIHKQNP